MKVAVVILNWNGLSFLKKFLPDVIRYSPEATVYVADNNSFDESIQYVEEKHPEVEIIQLPKNEGFCKGYNSALSQIEAEYYVLLNSDVQVTEGWISPIISLMESDPLIAACQPKIKSYLEPEYFEYAGAAGGFIDYLGYTFCRGRIFEKLEKDKGQYNDAKEIFWATGACMFIKAELFHKTGGFDDDFFAHMEEIDLCWRLKRLGYKIMYCGKSEVFHVGGGTLSATNPQKTYLNFRNNLALLIKNHSEKHFLRTILTRMLLDGIAAFKLLFSDSYKHFNAVIKAHFSVYGQYKKLYVKRVRLKKAGYQYLSEDPTVLKKSLIMQFFLFRKNKFGKLNF